MTGAEGGSLGTEMVRALKGLDRRGWAGSELELWMDFPEQDLCSNFYYKRLTTLAACGEMTLRGQGMGERKEMG